MRQHVRSSLQFVALRDNCRYTLINKKRIIILNIDNLKFRYHSNYTSKENQIISAWQRISEIHHIFIFCFDSRFFSNLSFNFLINIYTRICALKLHIASYNFHSYNYSLLKNSNRNYQKISKKHLLYYLVNSSII